MKISAPASTVKNMIPQANQAFTSTNAPKKAKELVFDIDATELESTIESAVRVAKRSNATATVWANKLKWNQTRTASTGFNFKPLADLGADRFFENSFAGMPEMDTVCVLLATVDAQGNVTRMEF
jgi:hypothetical protein